MNLIRAIRFFNSNIKVVKGALGSLILSLLILLLMPTGVYAGAGDLDPSFGGT